MAAREMKREAKNERGGEGKEGRFPSFLTPSLLTRAIFRAAFAPKQHGNACFAGYGWRNNYCFYDTSFYHHSVGTSNMCNFNRSNGEIIVASFVLMNQMIFSLGIIVINKRLKFS